MRRELASLEKTLKTLAKKTGSCESRSRAKAKKLFALEEQIADFGEALERSEEQLAYSREKLPFSQTGETRERGISGAYPGRNAIKSGPN